MFAYEFPGGVGTYSYINSEGQLKFVPPVGEQRYCASVRILQDPRWSHHFKKVVDFGCSEMTFLSVLRRVENVEHILEVDIDETLLNTFRYRTKPLLADYITKRKYPLRIDVLKGSIDTAAEELRNVDVVVALEVIEHLYPEVLVNVPANIFGFIQPKMAIISTPNADFNVLFGQMLPNGFRHADHKFEWTRAEFRKWAQNICAQYPNYSVSFFGLGKAPPDQQQHGQVTQVALFARNDIINRALVTPIASDLAAETDPQKQYQVISKVEFPFENDPRTTYEKIRDEAIYMINQCHPIEKYYNREREICQIPLARISETLAAIEGATERDLLIVLKENNYKVEGDFIVLPSYEASRYDDMFDTEKFDNGTDDDDDGNDALVKSFDNFDVTDDPMDEENWD